MMKNGFTLIEMLIVTAIVTLLAGVVIANVRTGNRGNEVRRSSQLLVAALREAQNDALGGKRAGVYVALSQNPILFIDQDGDALYDAGEEKRTIVLDEGVAVSSTTPFAPLHVFFLPPNPNVYINGASAAEDALVTIEHLSDASVARTVRINTLGLINEE